MSKIKIMYDVCVNDLDICGPHYYWNPEKNDSIATPEFKMWSEMVKRCFDIKLKEKIPSLYLSYCCDDWLQRINFQKWYNDQGVYKDNSGKTLSLDKDILGKSFYYSPESCVLIPQYLNAAIRDINQTNKINGLPLWVYYKHKSSDMINELNKPYYTKVVCLGKKLKGGFYNNPIAAHFEGQILKIQSLNILIETYQKERCYRSDVEKALQEKIGRLKSDHQTKVITINY